MPVEDRNIIQLFFLFNKKKKRCSMLSINYLRRYLSIYLAVYKAVNNTLSFPGISSDKKHTLYILRSFKKIQNPALAAPAGGFLSYESYRPVRF